MAKINRFKKQLEGIKRIGVDSSIFIYKFEQNKEYEPLCSVVFEKLSNNDIQLSTSIITKAEVLTKPLELKNQRVVELYETVFNELPNFNLIELDQIIARKAAEIRAEYKILLPDAFQIAACAANDVQVFITNDKKLKRIQKPKVMCLKDYI